MLGDSIKWIFYGGIRGGVSPLEWSVGYKMLNLTWLIVSLCSHTLALTADLTAECTEEECGVRVTALLLARQAATPC